MAENNYCHICENNQGKYTCPRCNIFYCSLSCYQSEKHIQCSEAFYEKWVEEELKNRESDPEARKKMLEIMKKEYQESSSEESLDSDDEESVPDLTDRLMNVNLDDEDAVWEKLTAEEKREFRKLVATGNIIKILPEWEPWWKTKKRKTLIQESEEEFDWKSICPPVLSEILELSQLTKSTPSPNIVFMVMNVLVSYVFTVRWFKGSHKDMPVEAVSTLIALSATLRDNQVFTNAIESFIAFEDDLSKCKWIQDKEEFDKNLLQEDLLDIINGSSPEDSYYCIKAALSDLNSLCLEALIIIKESKTNHLKRFSGESPKASQIQSVSKKMIYYLSWTQANGNLLKKVVQPLK